MEIFWNPEEEYWESKKDRDERLARIDERQVLNRLEHKEKDEMP